MKYTLENNPHSNPFNFLNSFRQKAGICLLSQNVENAATIANEYKETDEGIFLIKISQGKGIDIYEAISLELGLPSVRSHFEQTNNILNFLSEFSKPQILLLFTEGINTNQMHQLYDLFNCLEHKAGLVLVGSIDIYKSIHQKAKRYGQGLEGLLWRFGINAILEGKEIASVQVGMEEQEPENLGDLANLIEVENLKGKSLQP